MFGSTFQQLVFWLSFLVFPWLGLVFWQVFRKPSDRTRRVVWGVLLFLSMLFIYARFIEPQIIVVRHENLQTAGRQVSVRAAVISDLHLGVFKGGRFLKRVVEKINTEKVDLVLIPGDFINDPTPQQLAGDFAALGELKVPVYAVTGNHDAGIPGYYSSGQVRQALAALVRNDDNKVDSFQKEGRTMRIYGLSDLMEGVSDYSILDGMKAEEFNLILTHNPDTAHEIPSGLPVNLLVSGHTHGGQIFLPPLSNWMIPTVHPFVRGWYEVSGMPVYVSSGAGEVLLPMRFLIPPEIVILDLKI